MKSSKIFYLFLGVFAILVILIAWPYIKFGFGYLFDNPNDPGCLAIPEPPSSSDPIVPIGTRLSSSATLIEEYVKETATREFGGELIYAETDEASDANNDSKFIIWIRNVDKFKITEQREHWNPKIEATSQKIFADNSFVQELEYRMYYNNLLTYWVKVDRDLPEYTDQYWQRPRYSECTKAY